MTQFPRVGMQGRHSSIEGIQGSHSSKGADSDKLLIYEILKRHSLVDEAQGHWANTPLGEAKGRHWEDTVLMEDTQGLGIQERSSCQIERTQKRHSLLQHCHGEDTGRQSLRSGDKVETRIKRDTGQKIKSLKRTQKIHNRRK